MTQRILSILALGGAVAISSSISGAAASGQDVNAMAKWTSATIVRYQIVAEFSGETKVVQIPRTQGVKAQATDRFEVDLQWNQTEFSVVGTPVVKNFPSTRGALTPGKCPTTATGPFEHATVLAVKDDATLKFANAVAAEIRRDLQAGTLPTPSDEGPCAQVFSGSAIAETVRLAVPVPNGMMLAMPSGQGGYQHNGKAFIVQANSTEDKGWTFTVTPTIVR